MSDKESREGQRRRNGTMNDGLTTAAADDGGGMHRHETGNGFASRSAGTHSKTNRRGELRPGGANRNKTFHDDRARRKKCMRHVSVRMIVPYGGDGPEFDESYEAEGEPPYLQPVGHAVRTTHVVDPSCDEDEECCVDEDGLHTKRGEKCHTCGCRAEFDDGKDKVDDNREGDGEDFDIESLEKLANQLRQRCMEEGIAKAEHEWLDGPFSQWNESLVHGHKELDHDCACKLVVAMADELPVRDALILSLVGELKGADATKTMLRCATRPHEPANAKVLYRRLDRAFNDPMLRPNLKRCRDGIDMLLDMISRSPGRFCVQPLCVVAYTLWWLGDAEAGDFARRVLEHDGSCVLARIVCSAVDDGLCPAWRRP